MLINKLITPSVGLYPITAPWVLLRVYYNLCTYRIKFYIAAAGKQIIVFRKDDALASVLLEMSCMAVSVFIMLGIDKVDSFHYFR